MKNTFKSFTAIVLLLSVIFTPVLIYAFGTITHVGMAEDILNKARNGELPSQIASVILQYPEYFKSGSVAPDLFYANLNSSFSDNMHYKNTKAFFQELINSARTPEEKAYAYGAILHYTGDTIGHPYVNEKAGGVWGENIKYEPVPNCRPETELREV